MKKFSHKKGVTIALVALAAVAIGTVGFSAWIISAEEVEDDISVNITTDEVVDNRLEITVDDISDSLVIDASSSSSTGDGTISGDSDAYEQMSFAYSFTISLSDDSVTLTGSNVTNYFTAITLELDTSGSYYATWETIEDNNWLVLPTHNLTSGNELVTSADLTSGSRETIDHEGSDSTRVASSATLSYSANSLTVSGSLGLGWGSAFDYVNPVAMTSVTEDDIQELKEFSSTMQSVNSLDLVIGLTLA